MSAAVTLAVVIWPTSGVPRWWLPATGAVLATAVCAFGVVLLELSGPTPPVASTTLPTSLARGDAPLHLAGSGTCLPLAHALSQAYANQEGEPPPVVHGSIGSRGGLRASKHGVVDIGLVAMPSGRIPEAPGCDTVAIAEAAVVAAVHGSVSAPPSLSSKQLVALFGGTIRSWPSGQEVVLLLRERGDSATQAACNAVAGLADALHGSQNQWPVLLTDIDMAHALLATPGSVGFYDFGALTLENLDLGVIAIDGVAPSLETLKQGRYPIKRVFFFVISHDARPGATGFLTFVQSEAGRTLLEDAGYAPLDGEGS